MFNNLNNRYLFGLALMLLISFCRGQNPNHQLPLNGEHWITPLPNNAACQELCPAFHKSFNTQKPVQKATLTISALGLYEASLNANRVGKDYFTPSFVNYHKRVLYQTYDVTKLIRHENKLSVTIAPGWYRGTFRGEKPNNNYGDKPGLIGALNIIYKDGSSQVIVTDTSWKYTGSNIAYSELYNGEFYDSNYHVASYHKVDILRVDCSILLQPASKEPVRKQEQFKGKVIYNEENKRAIIDFGQNLAGWIQLNLKGKKGDTVRIEHAEVLEKENHFYNGNLRDAQATEVYVLNGKRNAYQPHFTYHGFRYARLTWIRNGKPISTAKEKWSAKAIALYSDLKKTGAFKCSNPLINQLQRNIEWSLNSNFFEIPTDCPQRSERLGWTGDAQVFAPTACFLRDTRNFYESWLTDMAGEQRADGSVPLVVPSVGNYRSVGGVAGWGDAAAIIPWVLYTAYGDTTRLRSQYPMMKGWVEYVERESKNGIWQAKGFGDWYSPGPPTDIGLIDQCFRTHSVDLLKQTAQALGETADAIRYAAFEARDRALFLARFTDSTRRLTVNTQTACVLALKFNMLPNPYKEKAIDQLINLIRNNNNHLATGFLGTPYLLEVLSANGRADVAYQLLLQDTMPSWLYPIKMGATTIWEKWDAMDPDGTATAVSYNHYAYGAVGQWLYENIGGIRSGAPGYSKIIIQPVPGGNLTWAKASYETNYGRVISNWRKTGFAITYDITIPKNTTAEIRLPGQPVKFVSADTYHFKI